MENRDSAGLRLRQQRSQRRVEIILLAHDEQGLEPAQIRLVFWIEERRRLAGVEAIHERLPQPRERAAADPAPGIHLDLPVRHDDADAVVVFERGQPRSVVPGELGQPAEDRRDAGIAGAGVRRLRAPVWDRPRSADAIRSSHDGQPARRQDLLTGAAVVPDLGMDPRRFAGPLVEVRRMRRPVGAGNLLGLKMQIYLVHVGKRDRRIDLRSAVGPGVGGRATGRDSGQGAFENLLRLRLPVDGAVADRVEDRIPYACLVGLLERGLVGRLLLRRREPLAVHRPPVRHPIPAGERRQRRQRLGVAFDFRRVLLRLHSRRPRHRRADRQSRVHADQDQHLAQPVGTPRAERVCMRKPKRRLLRRDAVRICGEAFFEILLQRNPIGRIGERERIAAGKDPVDELVHPHPPRPAQHVVRRVGEIPDRRIGDVSVIVAMPRRPEWPACGQPGSDADRLRDAGEAGHVRPQFVAAGGQLRGQRGGERGTPLARLVPLGCRHGFAPQGRSFVALPGMRPQGECDRLRHRVRGPRGDGHRNRLAAAPPCAVERRPHAHRALAVGSPHLDHSPQRVLAVGLRIERGGDAELIEAREIPGHVEPIPGPFQFPPVAVAKRRRPNPEVGGRGKRDGLARRPHNTRKLDGRPFVIRLHDPPEFTGGEVVHLEQLGRMRPLDHEVVAKDRDRRHGRERQADLALRLACRGVSLERRPLECVHRAGIVHREDTRDLLLPLHLAIETDAPQHAVAAAEIERLRRLAHAEVKGLCFHREGIDLHDLAGRTDPQDAKPVLVEAVEIATRAGLDPGRCIPLHRVVDEKLTAGGEVLEGGVVEVDRVVEM